MYESRVNPLAQSMEKHNWLFEPGEVGINYEAQQYLKKYVGKDTRMRNWSCTGDRQPYQRNLQALTHPSTPFKRMLVAWAMGLGKTRAIVDIFDQYYNDERPKLFVAPNNSLANMFYSELMDVKVDNKYQDWVLANQARLDSKSKGSPTHVDMLESRVRGYGRMPGDIRAMSFADVAKAPLKPPSAGQHDPKHSILWSTEARTRRLGSMRNPQDGAQGPSSRLQLEGLDSCIIVVDEAHRLMESGNEKLCKLLEESKNSVVMLFTGTPTVVPRADKTPGSMDRLLLIVAGNRVCYEGYVSFFADRTIPELFARAHPPLRALPNVIMVHMPLEFANAYAKERGDILPRDTLPGDIQCLAKGSGNKRKRFCNPVREGLASIFLEQSRKINSAKGKPISYIEAKIPRMDDASRQAPKLAQIVYDILARNAQTKKTEKTVIMIHSRNGIRTLEHILRLAKLEFRILRPRRGSVKEQKIIGVENDRSIVEFNQLGNKHGELIQVLVANEEHNEGLSVSDAQRIILADQTDGCRPGSLALLRQRVARALRMCRHTNLPVQERKLTIDLYVLDWEVGSRRKFKTIDMEKLIHITHEKDNEKIDEELALFNLSIDGSLYTDYPPGTNRPIPGDPRQADDAGAANRAVWQVRDMLGEWMMHRRQQRRRRIKTADGVA